MRVLKRRGGDVAQPVLIDIERPTTALPAPANKRRRRAWQLARQSACASSRPLIESGSSSTSSLSHHFFTMACNNAWANHRLLTAARNCRRPISSRRARASFPRSRPRSITSDGRLVLRRRAGTRASRRARQHEAAPLLRAGRAVRDVRRACAMRSAKVDRRLIDACSATDRCRARSAGAGAAARAASKPRSATRLLAHLFQHQIHHRGQAHAMLAGTPVKPPQLDEFFCANEAHLRAAELAELGLSEAADLGRPAADDCLGAAPNLQCSGSACCCLRFRSTYSLARKHPLKPRSRSPSPPAGTIRVSSSPMPPRCEAGVHEGQLVSASLGIRARSRHA